MEFLKLLLYNSLTSAEKNHNTCLSGKIRQDKGDIQWKKME